ncbi:VMA21-like domain-containing protein [Colletotrichum graminicola]|nr:VMA21-like domain-containing protein [Colletotrichum graminicola]
MLSERDRQITTSTSINNQSPAALPCRRARFTGDSEFCTGFTSFSGIVGLVLTHRMSLSSPVVTSGTLHIHSISGSSGSTMATRRIVASEKTILEKDDVVGSSPAAGDKSNITPAVPMEVIMKLLGFTFAMIVLPIGTYFATVDFLFRGNSTFAGALAAVMANVVLIGYIVVAMKEDQSDQLEAKKEAKKDR